MVPPSDGPPPTTVFPGFSALSGEVRDVIDHLAQRRRADGLSQTEVAARMRTSQSAVARLEAGQDDIRLSTLQRYARALGQDLRFAVSAGDDVEDV